MDINYYKQYEPIFGSWHITRQIGEGSFGKVFEIQREDFGTTYRAALKAITVPASETELRDVMADGMDEEGARAYYSTFVQDLVKEVSEEYDHIILDLSPGLGRLERSALIASDEIVTPMTPEVFSLDGLEIFIDELAKLKKNMRAAVKHNKIIINSYDERIRQHRDIFSAAEASGRFLVYRIPVDPLFRKAQEAGKVPQLYKVRGRGLKVATQQAIKDLDSSIWR